MDETIPVRFVKRKPSYREALVRNGLLCLIGFLLGVFVTLPFCVR